MSNAGADEMYRKMFDAWNAGEYAFALELSRDLLRQFPEFDIAWLLQGVMFYELARYDEAEKTLRRAMQLIPNGSLEHAYTHMGHLCKACGDYDEAARYYWKAIKLAPDNAGRYIFLGAVLAKKGDLAAAEEVHRKGTRRSEGRVDEAYLNLGYVLRAQERYREALICFGKALELTPDYEEALVAKRDIEKVLQYGADEACG